MADSNGGHYISVPVIEGGYSVATRNTKRKFPDDIKSLLHFNYPYYAEAGDGLGDEVSIETWTRAGSAKLVGAEIPADEIVTGTPKFGYRCLQTSGNSDYISCTNYSGIWNVSSSDLREVDFWIRPTASTAGNILQLMNSSDAVLRISKDTNNRLAIYNGTSTVTSTGILTLNTWQYVKISFAEGKAHIRINGTLTDTLDVEVDAMVSECRLGGFTGQLDEFCWKHSAENTGGIHDEYSGYLDFGDMGGAGTGNHGDVVINSDCIINSYARVTNVSGSVLTTGSWTNGLLGSVQRGDEVMVHVSLKTGNEDTYVGCYAFRTVAGINGNTLTLSSMIEDEFPLTSIIGRYNIQVILVPNFKSFTLNANKTIRALTWGTNTGGGLIVFRVKGDMRIYGNIISSGYGPTRTDLLQITHAKILDNFILNRGGGVMIFCGGSLLAASTARIGASWSGDSKGGTGSYRASGTPGGAGYGGAGGSDSDTNMLGGHGGVGGGGGGCDGAGGTNYNTATATGIPAGGMGNTGGNYNDSNVTRATALRPGGTQGISAGAIGTYGGGGGAGGNSTNGNNGTGAVSGANVIIIAKAANINPAAISTGGAGGSLGNAHSEQGGGGTGFCYLAVEEVL